VAIDTPEQDAQVSGPEVAEQVRQSTRVTLVFDSDGAHIFPKLTAKAGPYVN